MSDRPTADTEILAPTEVVRTLEEDQERIRARIAELEQLLREAEEEERSEADEAADTDTALHSPAELRAAVIDDLRAALVDAGARLDEVDATLDTVRLELERHDAGEGGDEPLNAALRSARDLSEEVDRFLTETPAP